jgi:transposase-like protein
MGKVITLRRRRRKSRVKGKEDVLTRKEFEALDLERRVALIQELIPIGLMAAAEELQREVEELVGMRYGRKDGEGDATYRFGSNAGTVLLGGQRVPILVPRIRSAEGEVKLRSYELLHRGVAAADERLMERVLYGVSCRNYEATVGPRRGAIGTSKSTVSKEFVAASSRVLRAFTERRLEEDFVAIFVDGKYFAEDEMVIALGVTMDGSKRILGFMQAGTENSRVLSSFFRSLLDRGLNVDSGVLVCIDGSKGIRSAALRVFKKRAVIQRCQWHKRENIVSYLPRDQQRTMRKRLQRAYERPTYEEATKALKKVRAELEAENQSALASLDEGFEETLTLHRLGIFAKMGRSFKTTNCIESINSMAEGLCSKITHWKNSKQKQRWLAAALRDIEPRLQRVQGYKHLPLLRRALMQELKIKIGSVAKNEAA